MAGIEITNSDIENAEFGHWIRPIDQSQNEGSLLAATTSIDGAEIEPLNVISIEFTSQAQDPNHPEDWFIDSRNPWEMLGKFDLNILPYLMSQPQLQSGQSDLWGGENFVPVGTSQSTLQLVKIETEREIVSGFESFQGEPPKLKTRMTCGTEFSTYKVSVTDPFFSQRHGISPQRINNDGEKRVLVPQGTYLVISLTPPPPFNPNRQYKVVATIFE